MCDPCLDNEDDVDRMALAQTDCPEKVNMKPKWVNDPNIPYDRINPINHCALFFVATKRIPANSKLCWYYPMVHQVTLPVLFAFAQVIILQADLLKLTEKDRHLKTPPYKRRDRDAERVVNVAKRGKTQPPQGAASVSPTSPTKSALTATARSVVGKAARNTHDAAHAAVLKQQQARLVSEKHVCDHFSKCTEGFCHTCKCDKCKARQPSGKRPSALRRF